MHRSNPSDTAKRPHLLAAVAALALLLAALSAAPAAADDPGELAATWDRHGNAANLGTIADLTRARLVNDSGQIVGTLEDTKGTAITSDDLHTTFFWEKGEMVALGTLGGSTTWADDLNARGQVVGRSLDEDGDRHGFLWGDGELIDLGFAGDYTTSWAKAINNGGQIAGGLGSWEFGDSAAFLWEKGEMTILPTLGGADAWASDINERGQIVGRAHTTAGNHHACLWHRGRVVDLGALAGDASEAYAINNRGQVIGTWWAGADINPPYHAFFWERGEMVDIAPGWAWSYPSDLNARGEVVGWVGDSLGEWRPFHWYRGELTVLPTLGGDFGMARAINNGGRVAGTAERPDGRLMAVLWVRGTPIELESPGTAEPTSGWDINNRGTVVGSWSP